MGLVYVQLHAQNSDSRQGEFFMKKNRETEAY